MEKPVAIVTGSSRGIGRSIAEQLAAAGYRTVVNSVSSLDGAQQVCGAIQAAGGEAIPVQANVGSNQGRDALINAAIQSWNRIDVLVNNAGITSVGRKDLLEATEASWDAVFDTNLKGAFFLSQLAANQMMRQARIADRHHYIVNISSISAYAASSNRADYCIAKAGMEMMTRLFAERLADDNIRVFEVCPGVIASDMTAPVKQKYDQLIADGLTPIRRWGEPTDIARTVETIVAGSLPFCTGQRINVDGGFHIRRL
ncbi:MAG: 3-ketoacyl-ACP reductase [Planctomycetales bacterium]|nr:3-ketoacyl-ACP reductase [Planctomycetales bacterium]